jgi:hypothetical protein
MSRTGSDQLKDGLLFNGYDYENQAWVKDGKYIRCGHPEDMECNCYGREHEGEIVKKD